MKRLITTIAAVLIRCALATAPAAEPALAEAANGQEAGPTIVKWEYVTGGTSAHETEVMSREPQRVLGLSDPGGRRGVLVEGGPACVYTTDGPNDPVAGAGGGRQLIKPGGGPEAGSALIELPWYNRTWVFRGWCRDRNIPMCGGLALCH